MQPLTDLNISNEKGVIKLLNMLIVDDDINCAKTLVSYILKNNKEIRLIDIALDGEEALNIVKNNNVDIILLDLKMPKVNGIEFINYLSEKNIIEEDSIIVITGEETLLGKIIKNPLVYCYSIKPVEKQSILSKICNLVNQKNVIRKTNEELDKNILKELEYLGYNLSHCGTKYLLDCIKIDYIKYDGEAENITKQIYPIISKKYHKTNFSIKNNIIKATDYMYNECEEKKLLKYFHYIVDTKPTPKTIIKTIVRKL